jgi:hypothetical protein
MTQIIIESPLADRLLELARRQQQTVEDLLAALLPPAPVEQELTPKELYARLRALGDIGITLPTLEEDDDDADTPEERAAMERAGRHKLIVEDELTSLLPPIPADHELTRKEFYARLLALGDIGITLPTLQEDDDEFQLTEEEEDALLERTKYDGISGAQMIIDERQEGW